MPRYRRPENIDDRTRILMTIIESLSLNFWATSYSPDDDSSKKFNSLLSPSVHFAGYGAKIGDLVVAYARGVCGYTVGYLLEERSSGGCFVIREIGTSRTCQFVNASYKKIANLKEVDTYDGVKRRIFEKVTKVLNDLFEYHWTYVPWVESISDDKEVLVKVRKKWSDETFDIRFKCNLSTPRKTIEQILFDNDYGTRFEQNANQTTSTGNS